MSTDKKGDAVSIPRREAPGAPHGVAHAVPRGRGYGAASLRRGFGVRGRDRGGVGRLRGVGGVGRRAERARAVSATLLENADVALELMWEHMWDYD